MTHGDDQELPDLVRQSPVAKHYAVQLAAKTVYEAALSSGLDLNEASLQQRLTSTLGTALFRLLDACHDLIEL